MLTRYEGAGFQGHFSNYLQTGGCDDKNVRIVFQRQTCFMKKETFVLAMYIPESDDGKVTSEDAVVEYPTCDLISSINYNGLFYFLLANLLTGLVNMSVKTIKQSNFVAMAILTCYMFVLSAVLLFLYKKKISLKVW